MEITITAAMVIITTGVITTTAAMVITSTMAVMVMTITAAAMAITTSVMITPMMDMAGLSGYTTQREKHRQNTQRLVKVMWLLQ